MLRKLAVMSLALLSFSGLAAAQESANSYRTYIEGPWGQIHVRVAGPEGDAVPTVFLLHQMVWSSVQFANVQPALAELGVRSIAVDLPGYGMSDGPDFVPSATQYAETLLPVMDAFGIERAILHGNHTGASIVLALATAFPERTDRLIVLGPPIFDEDLRQDLLTQTPFDQTPRPDGRHISGRWDLAKDSFGANTSLESQQQAILQFFIAGPNEWYAHDAVFRYDPIPAIRALNSHALVISNPGDSLHEASKYMNELRPDFSFVELEWSGAHAIYDAAQPWAAAVADYITDGS